MNINLPDPIEAGVHPEAHLVECFLDGEKIENAIKASVKEGWVDVYLKEESLQDRMVKVERRHGDVELREVE